MPRIVRRPRKAPRRTIMSKHRKPPSREPREGGGKTENSYGVTTIVTDCDTVPHAFVAVSVSVVVTSGW